LDILTFNTLIAQDVLIFFYYIGALGVPIFLWALRFYFLKKFSFYKELDTHIYSLFQELNFQKKLQIFFFFLALFLCMELCLRIIFEFMIAYFDIHNYLYTISKTL